jgi:hypothetical protein
MLQQKYIIDGFGQLRNVTSLVGFEKGNKMTTVPKYEPFIAPGHPVVIGLLDQVGLNENFRVKDFSIHFPVADDKPVYMNVMLEVPEKSVKYLRHELKKYDVYLKEKEKPMAGPSYQESVRALCKNGLAKVGDKIHFNTEEIKGMGILKEILETEEILVEVDMVGQVKIKETSKTCELV